MKLNPIAWLIRDEGETIATFGDARLVKKLNGKIELIGGSYDDCADAREWCSLFLHEALIPSPHRQSRRPRPGVLVCTSQEAP